MDEGFCVFKAQGGEGMIIVLQKDATENHLWEIVNRIKDYNLEPTIVEWARTVTTG